MTLSNYPFTPKSTKFLERGQFWAIPLPDGTYGAGCVLGQQPPTGKQSTRSFLAGVVAWHGNVPPTVEALSEQEVFKYALAHIKAITESGGQILGKANLKFHDLPDVVDPLSISTWGYNFPVLLASQYAESRRKHS